MTGSILIVEDDPANRGVFARILEREGWKVVTAENGFTALGDVGHHAFDAIVCDLRMPELSGMGFYAVLRELFPAIAARVIFVTAFADDPTVHAFLESAGRPVLHKPVELPHLVEAVRRMAGAPAS